MEELKKILREFDTNRSSELKAHGQSHFPNNESSDSRIASCFHPIADEILYHGHFVVKSKIDDSFIEYGIRIDALELYYNEELEGGYEDKKMYHINDRIPYYLKDRGIHRYPYYELGSFNLHMSGVDVTFENQDNRYRASFLIRKFSIVNADGVVIKDSTKTDVYSTHIFDYLFPNGVLCQSDSSIHWIHDDGILQHSELDFRQNLDEDIRRGKKWQFRRADL